MKPSCAKPTTPTLLTTETIIFPNTIQVASTKIYFSGLPNLPAILLEKIICIKDKDGIINAFLHVAEPSCKPSTQRWPFARGAVSADVLPGHLLVPEDGWLA